MSLRRTFSCGIALATLLSATGANAFSTRLHIAIANDVREAVIDAGGAPLPLFGDGGYTVAWTSDDVSAVLNQPLAFRAGAIGPDNMVFPGMTDPSHAVGTRPYEQCQLLYDAALTQEERAYAMGCFLHGSTDAIAHHYVNYMSGETFTLTPISNGRQESFANVARHILAEEMIQKAAFKKKPSDFSAGQLNHTIPKGFLLRTYLDAKSPLWAVMAKPSKDKLDLAVKNNPGASFVTVLKNANLAAADHLALTPHYVNVLEAQRESLRQSVQASVKAMQDPTTPEGMQLKVKAGPDGKLGTKDDTTACSASCASLYAKYFVYAGLLAPRYDAGGNQLPSAFDKLSDKLGDDVRAFLSAQLDAVENFSLLFNKPLPTSTTFGITKSEVVEAMKPMNDWAQTITTLDYETVIQAVVPDWLISLQDALNAVGVNVQIGDIVQLVFDPIILPIKDGIKTYVIDQATVYLQDLIDEVTAAESSVDKEYATRLDKAKGKGLVGNPIDNFYDSGLYHHSVNIALAALAEHKLVLPTGNDPVGIGPASFDASHTPKWMQAGQCDYLSKAIFPLGHDVKGTLTVKQGATTYVAEVTEDSPVECHDGSLFAFDTSPDATSCKLVSTEAVVADAKHVGSVSRAYPPSLSMKPSLCSNLDVPGLPPPPPPGTGGAAGAGGGATAGSGASGKAGAGGGASGSAQAGTTSAGGSSSAGASSAGAGKGSSATPSEDEGSSGGCGCETPGTSGNAAWGLAAIAAMVVARRRRANKAAALAVSSLALLGCGGTGDSGGNDPGGEGGSSAAGSAGSATAGSGTAGTNAAGTNAAGTSAGKAGTGGTSAGAGGTSAGAGGTSAGAGGTSAGSGGTAGGGGSAGSGGSGGKNMAGQLLKDLGSSRWNGTAPRPKGGKTVTRQIEMQFDADGLQWAELENPFGPSRKRKMRVFSVDADGASVHSTVISPGGWPVPVDNGKKEDFTIKVIAGSPRKLEITPSGGAKETYTEGETPAPAGGLTAMVNSFSAGQVSDAFCTSGAGGFDYPLLFDFARGKTSKDRLAQDVVAGAKVTSWHDGSGANQFAVTDLDGFNKNGGTDLSDQYNFFVRYTGTLSHAGGALQLRELDDVVEDGVWVFVGGDTGSIDPAKLFLEVHGFVWPDKTPDEPTKNVAAGDVPIEVIIARCAKQISDVDLQIHFNNGWQPLSSATTKPVIDQTLFPPALF